MSHPITLAFLGGSVGAGEWLVLFVVVLIVVGPKRMPEVARKIGRMMEMFRRAADEFKSQLMSMDQEINSSVGNPHDYGSDSTDESDSSGYMYPEDSDYPGNEDHVESWQSENDDAAAPAAATDPTMTNEAHEGAGGGAGEGSGAPSGTGDIEAGDSALHDSFDAAGQAS